MANATGVSIKTVSRAIHGQSEVSEATRERILQVANELGYYPNLAARSLRTSKTYTVGYVIPDVTNTFFGEVAVAMEKYFSPLGISILVAFSHGEEEDEQEALRSLVAKQVDGIVLATVASPGEHVASEVLDRGTPLVVIDNIVQGQETDLVLQDDVHGAQLLTQHLLDQGYERIACVTGHLSETSGSRRLEGYKQALQEAGQPIDPSLVAEGDWTIASGYEATRRLIEDNAQKPTAIFYSNSLMAMGAYKALKQLRLQIPQEIGIVGFDELEVIEALDPSLTTLGKVDDQIGELAAKRLYERMSSSKPMEAEEYLIRGELQIRDSSCPAG